MGRKLVVWLSLALLVLAGADLHAQIRITEWMYSGTDGEYAEFTNVSNSPIDMTNWSEDDNTGTPGVHAFGTTFGAVQPGESVILTESPEASFRTAWNLPSSVKVWAGPTGTGYSEDNLGRSDEINLYDNLGSLIDRLTYDDQGSGNVDSPRTQNISGNIPLGALGANNASLATLSFLGDTYMSSVSTGGDVGNPGKYTPFTPVPEPSSLVLLIAGSAIGLLRRRHN